MFQPPWLFDLEGTVLDFLSTNRTTNRTTINYLTLEVDQECMTIILPKTLQRRQPLDFQPGDRIRCIGHSRLNNKAKAIELTAYQICALS